MKNLYHNGNPCVKCGSNLRYNNTNKCVACRRNRKPTQEQKRAQHIKSAYGISMESVHWIAEQQEGKCADDE